MFYYTKYKSIIGNLIIVSDKDNIIGLWIEGQKYFCENIKGQLIKNNNLKILIQTKNWLIRYFNGEKPNIKELSLKPIGSPFRKIIWNILGDIPYGHTTTYGQITKQVEKILNKKMSAQAVGGAISHNPISIIIPCHRVVGKNGNLTGYAGGINNKKKLLKLEKTDMTNLYIKK